jgi:hypothetical protein
MALSRKVRLGVDPEFVPETAARRRSLGRVLVVAGTTANRSVVPPRDVRRRSHSAHGGWRRVNHPQATRGAGVRLGYRCPRCGIRPGGRSASVVLGSEPVVPRPRGAMSQQTALSCRTSRWAISSKMGLRAAPRSGGPGSGCRDSRSASLRPPCRSSRWPTGSSSTPCAPRTKDQSCQVGSRSGRTARAAAIEVGGPSAKTASIGNRRHHVDPLFSGSHNAAGRQRRMAHQAHELPHSGRGSTSVRGPSRVRLRAAIGSDGATATADADPRPSVRTEPRPARTSPAGP